LDPREQDGSQEVRVAAQEGPRASDRKGRRGTSCTHALVERRSLTPDWGTAPPFSTVNTMSQRDPNRVMIFDTTLRDGEQSPGCSMTQPEKLRMAKALAALGVDIIEAGFPIASRVDWG